MKPRLAKPVRLNNVEIKYRDKGDRQIVAPALCYVRTLGRSSFITEMYIYDAKDVKLTSLNDIPTSYRDYFAKYI